MDNYVTDTQVLVKFMMGRKVINKKAHQAFLAADKGKAVIIIPAIVLMGMLYLFEKHCISISLLQTDELLKTQNYHFEPPTLEILRTASEIDDIPELNDLLITATACYLDLPLITKDTVIQDSRFVTILE